MTGVLPFLALSLILLVGLSLGAISSSSQALILFFGIAVVLLLALVPEMGVVFFVFGMTAFSPIIQRLSFSEGTIGLIAVSVILVGSVTRHFPQYAWTKLKELPKDTSVLCVILLGVFFLIGQRLSPAAHYSRFKVLGYLVFDLCPFIIPFLACDSPIHFKRMVYASAALGLLYAFLSSLQLALGGLVDIERLTIGSENPIWFGRALGVGAITLFVLGRVSRSEASRAVLWILGFLLAFFVMLTGSRGPLIGLVLTAFILLMNTFKFNKIRGGILLALAALAIWGIITHMPPLVQERWVRFSQEESVVERVFLWDQALKTFFAHPLFGIGTGGFAWVVMRGDIPYWPHNLLLEIASELGVIGLVVLFPFLIHSGIRAVMGIFRPATGELNWVGEWAGLLFLFSFASAMVSGDITGNGGIWLAAGVLLTLRRLPRLPLKEGEVNLKVSLARKSK